MVKSPRIRRGDWLTLQVKVTTAWDDGRITVEHLTGQKVTMGSDSPEIIEITTCVPFIADKKRVDVTEGGETISSSSNQKANEAAAIAAGRKAYQEGGLGQAVLHKRDGGTIREERTYGKDPARTPG